MSLPVPRLPEHELESGTGLSLSSHCRDISEHVQRKSKYSSQANAAKIAADTGDGVVSIPGQAPGRRSFIGRISRFRVTFLTAARGLLEEEEEVLESDRAAFALRIRMIANYGTLHLVACMTAVLYWSVASRAQLEQIIIAAHALCVVCIFCAVHLVNRHRWMRQTSAFNLCAASLVFLNLFGAPLIVPVARCQQGWHWSAGLVIAMLGAPCGAVVLTDRPVLYGSVATTVFVLSIIGVVATFAIAAPAGPEIQNPERFVPAALAILIPYWLIPAMFSAAMFRWACQEHRSRLQSQAAQHAKMAAIRSTLQELIFSIVPESKVESLPGISPELWYRSPYDQYPHCTLLQMDVSGFTALSSRIEAAELVELIQSLFVSIDFAAECLRSVWKIELIGDCYKAIIGGPQPCADHAIRGVALAHSIVALCKTIASRLKVRLSVRVAVHTGSATAAVVGVRMPRYLMFGRACEVVARLEAGADRDSVLISRSTAEAVSGEWPHTVERHVTLADGSEIQAFSMGEDDAETSPLMDPGGGAARRREGGEEEGGGGGRKREGGGFELNRLLRVQHRFPALVAFVRDFEHSVQAPPAPSPTASTADSPSFGPGSAHDSMSGGGIPPLVSGSAELREGAHGLSRRIRTFAFTTNLLARRKAAHSSTRPSFSRVLPGPSDLTSSSGRETDRVESSTLDHHDLSLSWLDSDRGLLPLPPLPPGSAIPDSGSSLRAILEQTTATSPSFQRDISKIFLGACALTAAVQIILLLVVSADERVPDVRWERDVLESSLFAPALLLGLIALFALAVYFRATDWSSGCPQAGASVLLFAAAVGLEGAAGKHHHTRWPALLWAFLGVLVQCASSGLASHRWKLWLVLHLGLCLGVVAWVMKEDHVFETVQTVSWLRDVLMGWSFAIGSSLLVVPLAMAAASVRRIETETRELLLSTQRHLQLEDELAAALAPPELSRRFLRGDHLVVEAIEEGTAMFVYVEQYKELALSHGTQALIAWATAIFQCFDGCIDRSSSVTKVETFNDFILVFSTKPKEHVRVCLSLACDMLKCVQSLPRPDGTPTTLKVGVSSGAFTTAIIGLQSPRFSIFGDTVNTASRMASTSVPCTAHSPFAHISPSSWDLLGTEGLEEWVRGLGEGMEVEERGEELHIKGKGLMRTYCLTAHRPWASRQQQTQQ